MARRGSLLAVVALGVGFVVTGGCWSATEATLRLSTDLACGQSLRTVVYVGAPNAVPTAPVADTTACTVATAAGADNEIGTLTIVPGGTKDGRVEVRAVIAKNGQDPARCVDDGADCIVQTRLFSFIEHAAQSIPIRLLQQCLGTICPAGETCVGPQQCAPIDVVSSCTEPGGCLDASAPDASVVVPPATCEQRGKDGVLAEATEAPGDLLSTLVRTPHRSIVWLDGKTSQRRNLRATPVSGAEEIGFPGGGATAVADTRDGYFAVTSTDTKADPHTTTIGFPAGGHNEQVLVGVDGLSLAARGNLALLGELGGVELLDTNPSAIDARQRIADFPGARVAMTTRYLVASDAKSGEVYRFDYTSGGPSTKGERLPVSEDGGLVALAVTPDGAHAVVAGRLPGSITLPGTPPPGVPIVSVEDFGVRIDTGSSERVTSLAVDAVRAYWTHGNDGITYGAVNRPRTTIAAAGQVSHIAVDDDCIYYWRTFGNRAQLRAITKPQ